MKTLILLIFYILNIFNYFLKANDINFETFKFIDSTIEIEDFLLVEIDINDPKKRNLIIQKLKNNKHLHDKIILKKVIGDNRLRLYIHHGYFDGIKATYLLDDILELPNHIRNKKIPKVFFLPIISDIIGIFYFIYLYSIKKYFNYIPLKDAFIISRKYKMIDYQNKKEIYKHKYSLTHLILADIGFKITQNTNINNFLIVVANDLSGNTVNNLIPIIFTMKHDTYDNFINKFIRNIKVNYFLIKQSENILQLRSLISYYLNDFSNDKKNDKRDFDVVLTLIPFTNISVPYLKSLKIINKRPRSMLYINVITNKDDVFVSYNSMFNEFKNFNID
jgi:hypothetical protein